MSVEEIIAQWQAEEANVRASLGEAGVASPEQVIGLSGMQVFEGIFSGQLPQPPMGETLNYVPIRMAHGVAVFQGRPLHKHYNPMGTVHGGWFSTLLDSALGCAIHTTLPAGKGYTTLELKINLIRALTASVPLVRAEGMLVHAGKQVATAEAKIVGPDGKLYAHATTTCLIFDMPPTSRK